MNFRYPVDRDYFMVGERVRFLFTSELLQLLFVYPRANGAKRRSGCKPGRGLLILLSDSGVQSRCSLGDGDEIFMVCHDVMPTDLNNITDYRIE